MQIADASLAMGITTRHLRKLMSEGKIDYQYVEATITMPTIMATIVDISKEAVANYRKGLWWKNQ